MSVPRSFEFSLDDDVRDRWAGAEAAAAAAAEGESADAVKGAVVDEGKKDVVAVDDCRDRDCAIPTVEDPVATTDATPFAVIDCLFSRCNRNLIPNSL